MKNFYLVNATTTSNSSDYTFAVTLNKEHRIYQGHFPQQPVVPGVCMIQMIRELAEQATGRTLMYSGISNIKFLSVVDPTINSNLIIKLALDHIEDGGYSVKASIELTDETFLSLKGNLSAIKTSSEIDFSAIDKVQ